MSNKCAVILAGGEGKRMKSDIPKPMNEVLGKPMLRWVIDSVKAAGIDDICVVTGYKTEITEGYLDSLPFEVSHVLQSERLGTGHAVMMAKDFLNEKGGDVVIEETLAIKEVNSGGYWFDTMDLLSVLDDIKANNSAKEYYLPDALYLLLENGKKVGAFTAKSPDTVLGANDPAQLAELNEIARKKGYC